MVSRLSGSCRHPRARGRRWAHRGCRSSAAISRGASYGYVAPHSPSGYLSFQSLSLLGADTARVNNSASEHRTGHRAHGFNGRNIDIDGLVYPPPFALHANLLTCGIGLMTLFSLWTLLPVLHYCGYERFRLPPDLITTLSVAGIAGSGLVSTGGLMVTGLYISY
jgi:hypothetical protein